VGATSDFVLAFVGAVAVASPALAFANSLLGSPLPGLVAPAAFALAFGASYPLVAGGWSIARLYDVLLVAVAVAVPGAVVLAAIWTALDLGPPPSTDATGGWLLALAAAYAAVTRFDVRVLSGDGSA